MSEEQTLSFSNWDEYSKKLNELYPKHSSKIGGVGITKFFINKDGRKYYVGYWDGVFLEGKLQLFTQS